MISKLCIRRSARTIAIALAAACSSARPGPPAPVTTCVVGGGGRSSARDTLSIAAMAPVDWSHVPEPTNGAERLVFAQLYETLIDVDCEGHARPALASSWTFDATRTRITLSLRAGARFSSGGAVTASEVVAAWQATSERSLSSARLIRQIASGTTVIDDRTLLVSLPDTGWLVLAEAALAVYVPEAARVPEGSGPFRLVEQSAAPQSGAFVLTPIESADPNLLIRQARSLDPRDAIDAGTDVLITDDPAAVSYAAARAGLASVPLPWTRTYAVALPNPASRIAELLLRPESESVALRSSLARDAVHAQARAAETSPWWNGSDGCGAMLDSQPTARATDSHSNRVVYRRDDATARGLAERLVALDGRSVAAGLAPNDFTRALNASGDAAYVMDLARTSLSSCNDRAALRSAAPWLANTGAMLVPLIDTRETAIVNRDRVSATADWRGVLHFGGAITRP